jgi:tetratricopeptide (TPR) repeat protein
MASNLGYIPRMNLKELALANELSQRCDELLRGPLDFKNALPLAQKALKIRERILGDLHPSTITLLKDVGAILLEVGRAEEALPVILRELSSLEGVYGADSKEYTYGLSLLSRCYEALGNYQEALKCLWIQINIENRENLVGEAAMTKICLARCLHKVGKSEEAIRLLEDARAILKNPKFIHFKAELKVFVELTLIEKDLRGKIGLKDLFGRLVNAVMQLDEWQQRRAPKQLIKIAMIYAEAGMADYASEIDGVSKELAAKYPEF